MPQPAGGYDVERVRALFPALAEGAAHFDGPGGTQTASPVAAAVADALRSAVANRGRLTRAEQRADEIVRGAREAVADLLGARPEGVIFGRSMTALTYELSRALAKSWRPGDEVVITRLDHDANIRPWIAAAAAAGATVRWADFDPDTAELPAAAVTDLLTERTRLVAVTGAANLVGTRPPVAAITAQAAAAGALTYVDGVHLTPHAPVDLGDLGADFYACSPYKFCGPHLGLVAADPTLLATLHPDKLLPATDDVPERFELGTLPYELLAGVIATVGVIADLVPITGSRRQRVGASMRALEQYEAAVFRRLVDGLDEVPRVRRIGAPAYRTPTALFTVDGWSAQSVAASLATCGVNAPAGHFYAIEAARHLGLGDAGAVRAGIAPYTTLGEVDRLLNALSELPR